MEKVLVAPQELAAMMKTEPVVITDTRDPEGVDFAPRKGRLPGATWIEWYRMMKPSASGPVFKTPMSTQR